MAFMQHMAGYFDVETSSMFKMMSGSLVYFT